MPLPIAQVENNDPALNEVRDILAFSRQHALTVQGLQSETESWSKTNGVVSRN